MIKQVETIVFSKAFINEMSRFIPADVQARTLKKEKFLTVLANENKQLLTEVLHFLAAT